MKKIGNKLTLQQLLEDIYENSSVKENEFTAADFMKEIKAEGVHISMRACLARLEKLVETGNVSKRKLLLNGRPTNIYCYEKRQDH
jgi:hypothetical protein